MQPYFERGGIQIYHGDCREILPTLAPGSVDVIVTDPPYGVSHFSNRSAHMYGELAAYRNRIEGDDTTESRDWVLRWAGDRPCIVFGTWKMPRPANVRTVLIWDKGEACGMGDTSLPWKPSWEEIYVIGSGFAGHRGGGVLRAYVPPRVAMGRVHAMEKPVNLLTQLIHKCPAGVIVDPFMGSGSTLRAAANLGRRAIGIEIEERYCHLAAERLSQQALPLGAAS